jgi:Putative adhesin
MAAMTAPLPLTRGRRVALGIGVPVCLLLIAYNAFDLVATFGEGKYPVSYTAPATTRALTLNVTGELTIKPTRASRATLTGTARYSLVRAAPTEHTSAGATTLGYACKVPVGDCGLDATVTVPATVTTLTANSGGGNATVTGTTGPVNLSTGDGDLSVSHASGPVTLNTASGSIQVSAIRSATLSASSGDGNIQATGVTSPTITVNTDSGNIINWTGIATATITASTGSGDIQITFTSVPRDVRVNTNSGTITLLLPRGATKYDVMANTDQGNVSDAIPKDTSSSHVITASSGSGNITISEQ